MFGRVAKKVLSTITIPEPGTLAITAMRQDGYNLKHASEVLRQDHDVVLAALNQNGYSKQGYMEVVRMFGTPAKQ